MLSLTALQFSALTQVFCKFKSNLNTRNHADPTHKGNSRMLTLMLFQLLSKDTLFVATTKLKNKIKTTKQYLADYHESLSSKKYGLAVRCIMWGAHHESSATELIPDKPAAEYVQQKQKDSLIFLFFLPHSPHLNK